MAYTFFINFNFICLGLILKTCFKNLFCISDETSFSCFCKLLTDESIETHSTSTEEWVLVDHAII